MATVRRKNSYVSYDISKFVKLQRNVSRGARGPLRQAYQKMGVRYLTFLRQHFRASSAGDGEWPALAESTLKKKKKKGHRRKGILRVTDTLYRSLNVGAPGNVFKFSDKGLEVGIGGSAPHNDDGIAIGRLAYIHNRGLAGIPQRVIIVKPDPVTSRGFIRDIKSVFPTLLR